MGQLLETDSTLVRLGSRSQRRLWGLRWSVLALVVLSALPGKPLGAQEPESGVSPSRISLPAGPGSLEGVGENADVSVNMGLMSYGVPLELPEGYPGLTPDLRLQYSSGGGQSVVGMGWSLSVPSIERMTSYGLPRYDRDDTFAYGGGEELVRVEGSTRTRGVYRARYEGGFIRFTWVDGRGDGREGYWTAEYPDGRVGYFGADATGDVEDAARVEGGDGTFRYHLVEMRDTLGHSVRYGYEQDGGSALLVSIEYVFAGTGAGRARYVVTLTYASRPDQLIDGRSGREIRLRKRLVSVAVHVGGALLRRYDLVHGDYGDSGGFTRLAAVEQVGAGGVTVYPIRFAFDYTGARLTGCDACEAPYLHDMTVGADIVAAFARGDADLVDLNGDALPDLIDTTDGHRFRLNRISAGFPGDGGHSFGRLWESQAAAASGLALSNPNVHLFDVDSDGLVELVDRAGEQLWRLLAEPGAPYEDETLPVEWGGPHTAMSLLAPYDSFCLPDMTEDADLRFFDYDGDAAMDLLHSDEGASWVHLNRGDGVFEIDEILTARPLGVGFRADGAQMADLNGDGLQDLVLAVDGLVSYRANLGYGRFAHWHDMDGVPDAFALPPSLVDLNGDSLADLVVVAADTVAYWLNENGSGFGASGTLAEAGGIAVPERTLAEVQVRFADMNGNGSTDVVWLHGSDLTYLELFPTRPHLLARITNGIGMVQEVTYGTATAHRARDSEAGAHWPNVLPNAVLTVDRLDRYDTLSGVHEVRRYRYHDGFYDGEERQFRGFASVEVATEADEWTEALAEHYQFEVGDDDPYRKGLLTSVATFSAGRALDLVENTWSDCDVALAEPERAWLPEVRWLCQAGTQTTIIEGQLEGAWVVTRSESDYDGFGNVVRASSHGVTSVGGGECAPCDREAGLFGAPCGAECLGDEQVSETTFVPPSATGGRWLLRLPCETRQYGAVGDAQTAESRTYYDGEPFAGLPLCQATRGLATRRTARERSDSPDHIELERLAYGAHGEVLAVMDANHHQRTFTYDVTGRLPTSEAVVFDDAERSEPYRLRMSVAYDEVYDRIIRSTSWAREVGSEPDLVRSGGQDTLYAYDEFVRLRAIARPGDDLTEPTERFRYELRSPISRIVQERRSEGGAPADLFTVQCFDGRGRAVQTRQRIAPGSWQVSGWSTFGRAEAPALAYQPYLGADEACDFVAPEGVLADVTRFDGRGRMLEHEYPDASLFGTPSVERTSYLPLATEVFDGEDTDPSSPHFDTPTVTRTDGLGREVRVSRFLGPGRATPRHTDYVYDGLGNLAGFDDAGLYRKRQAWDLLGRIVSVEEPDTGETSFAYDAAGNLIGRTDARGVTLAFAYDEANRRTAFWDAGNPEDTRVTFGFDVAPEDCPEWLCTEPEGRGVATAFPVLGLGFAEPTGQSFQGYDERGRPIAERRVLAGVTFETTTGFDNADRVRRVSYPGGIDVESVYDGADRVVAVPGLATEIRYDERGLVDDVALVSGWATTVTWDDRMWQQARTTTTGLGETAFDLSYARDRVGNIGVIEDSAHRDGAPGLGATYTYDAWYRLTSAALEEPRPSFAETVDYEYDLLDNITVKTSSRGAESPVHIGAYSYDPVALHRLTSAGGVAVGHDAAGNMTTLGARQMDWDHLGRLVSVQEGGEPLLTAAYGPDLWRVAHVDDGQAVLTPRRELELRDGRCQVRVPLSAWASALVDADCSELLVDVVEGDSAEADGAIDSADAWLEQQVGTDGDPLVDPDALLRLSARRLAADQEVTVLAHLDHLGSTLARTDDLGEPMYGATFYPYGAVRSEGYGAGGVFGENPRYTGKELHRESGLTYFGARYLEPRLGQWVSADPLFGTLGRVANSADGTQRYMFTAGNPIGAIDRIGLESTDESSSKRSSEPELGEMTGEMASSAAQDEAAYRIIEHGVQRADSALNNALERATSGLRYLDNYAPYAAVSLRTITPVLQAAYHAKDVPEAIETYTAASNANERIEQRIEGLRASSMEPEELEARIAGMRMAQAENRARMQANLIDIFIVGTGSRQSYVNDVQYDPDATRHWQEAVTRDSRQQLMRRVMNTFAPGSGSGF